MATGSRDGGTAIATRPQPGRSPQGPAPLEPDATPKPALAGPVEPPHPALQAAGFNGGIGAFNQKIAQVVQAHQDAYGAPPPPGLALDVARSDLRTDQYADLFQVPKSPTIARLQGVVQTHDSQNPVITRPDGIVVAHTPLTTRLQAAAQDAFNHGDQQTPQTATQLQAEHPWVPREAGFLPIPNFGGLVDALGRLDSQNVAPGANGELTIGGKTLAEYQREVDLTSGLGSLSAPAAPPGSQLAKQQAAVLAQQKTALTANAVTRDITTVKQAQQHLADNYPAYFTGLAADGNFNQDWVRAVARFQSSAAYYRASTQQLAKDNHFNNPADFAAAWRNKQDTIRKNPADVALYSRVPLAFFGNGSSVINYLDGDTHGWGFLNVPTVLLHSIVGVAKTAVFGAGAVVADAKAQSASAVDFFHQILPSYLGGNGEGLKEADAHSLRVAQENPSYLRVFYPDLAAHPHGALGAIDALSNLAGDVILGNRLVVGGSAVKVGDRAALASNRYFKGATQLAFNSMRKRGIDGVGEASKLLQGGEGLNVAVADAVKGGDLSLAEYRAHVADVYHHGRTEVATLPTPRTDYYYNQFGQAFPQHLLIDTRTTARNITDKGGNTVGSVVFDARPEQKRIYVESVYIAPEHRNIDSLKRLLDPLLADGRPISADFQNPRLEKVFAKFAAQRNVGDKILEKRGGETIAKGSEAPRQPIPAPEQQSTVLHASDTPNGSVLSSLRTKNLPNPSLRAQQVKAALDQTDAALQHSGLVGTNAVADLLSGVREQVARAAPRSETRRIYDAKTPDDLYNWVVRNLDDRELAAKSRNDFVVARARQDIPAIQDLNRSLLERYAATHPNVAGRPTPLESSGPQSEAEGLANLKFIGGRQTDATSVFDRLGQKAQAINSKLLSAARLHRQVIISGAPLPGGEGLFWKHAIADTGRRFAGGAGLRFGLNADQKTAAVEVKGFFKSNPSALSDFSAQRASAEMGEVAWLTRNRPEQYVDFNTGDHLADAKRMEGAGAYLRHMVTDDALNAYRASTAADKTALFRHVWHSPLYQNLIAKSADFQKDAAALKAGGARGDALKASLSDLKKSYAQDWADALWARYRAIDDAGTTAGVPNALEQAAQVAREHPGAKIDTALGKFIKENSLAFDVREAPVKGAMFDGLMSRWVSKLLTFNKLNRRTFFDHIFYDTFHELAAAGWERGDAVTAASALAKSQTIYHMLDFSNMLQVEQNLRWLSYYATKHRLYWTWIARQFAKKPLLAAAVNDISQHLDSRGNMNVSVHGHELVIPAARLVWAANSGYPETSPIVETLFRTGGNVVTGESLGNAIAGAFAAETATSGNVITRQDQGIALLSKYIGMLTGKAPATYGLAVQGMSGVQQAVFNEEMHNVILGYRAAHDGRYPSEADAVKSALLRATGNEVWRTNLFLPILPKTGKPTAIQNLIAQFGQLSDPKARRAFLAKHPEIPDYFGATQDQGLYLHEQPLWDQFNAISKQRDIELARVRAEMVKSGYTVEIAKQVKAISQRYSVAIQRLRQQDALTWKGNATYPAGRIADNGEIQVEGPWSRKLDGDPLAAKAFVHEAFPAVTQAELDKHTIGQTVLDLQNEAARIRQLGWQQLGYPDQQHAKDRLSQINQTIDVFRSMPGNATTVLISDYYKRFVDPYIKVRDELYAEQKKTSSADKNVVFALNRAIKERYDHPVMVRDPATGKDVRFPSPVSFGFTMLPSDQYRSALAGAVSGRWQDITGYEKTLLGIKTPPHVAEGWAQYQQTVQQWRDDPANAGHSLQGQQKASLARQVDRVYPGFYKDYLFSLQPKVDRFERTVLYQRLPSPERTLFDQYLGGPAKQLAQAIKQSGSGAARMAYWRDYVRTEIVPWLASQKVLKAELDRYGADFLNTLPSSG